MDNIDNFLSGLITREGGFVDNSADRGGATKFGITQQTLSQWLGRPATLVDVSSLTAETAIAIYKALYVVKPGFMLLSNDALIEQLIDAAVNHGPTKAIELLQESAGTKVDGVIGPETIQAVAGQNRDILYLRFIALRLRLYAGILAGNASQQEFASGWINRCATMMDIYVAAIQG